MANIFGNDQLKELCINLARAENEEEVIRLLDAAGLWRDLDLWVDYDRNPNNFSTIGNQQSSPDAALVEKIINSVDAVLMRECLRRGIKPDSDKAPNNIQQALKEYFNIYDGKLSSIDAIARSKIAENILLVSTGEKSRPCYTIIDYGEGQTPKNIPNTFLSLNKNNKLRIQFVQGKFNMGGTGALQFCSPKHNLQLIISKRDPEIVRIENDQADNTRYKWGFTIIRRVDPTGSMRSSSFKYLAPNGNILMFDAPYLPILPRNYPQPYGDNMDFGSYIKLYEYQLAGYKTNILFDLYNRLSLLMPGIALPIRLIERRSGYTAHSYETTLAGLSIRLEEDKKENLEAGFPSSSEMRIKGQEMKVLIYAFKKEKREKYSKNEGIIFVVNGQAHGFISQRFFERKSVGMSYLVDSILVIVDCSKFERRIQEDLFMNSRDRLRNSPIRDDIESQLEELIKNHPGLRSLREQRRREEIENRLKDSRPLTEALESIIRSSPTLTRLFIYGNRITNPFNFINSGISEDFKGKRFPTYFKLTQEYSENNPKSAPINRRFRIQFDTDAENEYFIRDEEPGEFSIYYKNQFMKDYTLNLWNGTATLTVSLPDDANEGELINFRTELIDNSRINPFVNELYVLVKPPESIKPGKKGERKKPIGEDNSDDDRKKPSGLSLPNIIELRKVDKSWESLFKFDEDAIAVKDAGDDGYDFYINLDNIYLFNELKNNNQVDPKTLEARFKYGMVLLGISLLNYHEKNIKENNQEKDDNSVFDQIKIIGRAISPVILPMISSLGDLDLE